MYDNIIRNIMKKALRLALIYLILLIAGILLGTMFYTLYLNLLDFIIGHEVTFFSDGDLYKAFFYVFQCMLILICPVISYYRIRHPGGILQFIVYLVLCLVTWLILFPACMHLNEFCNSRFSFEKEQTYLSSNYFRRIDDKVYFFTKEFTEKPNAPAESNALIIDLSENGKIEEKAVTSFPTEEFIEKAMPYKEDQLKKIFTNDASFIPVSFHTLIAMGTTAFRLGLPYLLTLLSFVLLLCSVYGLTNFFDWRLINAVMLFIITTCILSVNSMYYQSAFDGIKQRLGSYGFFIACRKIISEPILFFINCVCALIFILAGVIKLAVRKHAEKIK